MIIVLSQCYIPDRGNVTVRIRELENALVLRRYMLKCLR